MSDNAPVNNTGVRGPDEATAVITLTHPRSPKKAASGLIAAGQSTSSRYVNGTVWLAVHCRVSAKKPNLTHWQRPLNVSNDWKVLWFATTPASKC